MNCIKFVGYNLRVSHHHRFYSDWHMNNIYCTMYKYLVY